MVERTCWEHQVQVVAVAAVVAAGPNGAADWQTSQTDTGNSGPSTIVEEDDFSQLCSVFESSVKFQRGIWQRSLKASTLVTLCAQIPPFGTLL